MKKAHSTRIFFSELENKSFLNSLMINLILIIKCSLPLFIEKSFSINSFMQPIFFSLERLIQDGTFKFFLLEGRLQLLQRLFTNLTL